MKSLKSYSCDICNKSYSSYQSLWIHNKKFHVSKVIQNVSNDNPNVSNKLLCKYCKKKFSTTQNKWKHENKVCKVKKR
jgi:hypothetical protein